MKTYEGMFLLDAGEHGADTASEPIREVLARVDAEVLSMKPWDERRLCFAIKGRKRGLYVLAYFKGDPARMAELQHEVHLNQKILRALVLSADHLPEEVIHAETPATLVRARRAAAEAQKAARAKAKAAEEDNPPPAEQDKPDRPPEAPPASPVADEPKQDEPKQDEPKQDEPKQDEPKQDSGAKDDES